MMDSRQRFLPLAIMFTLIFGFFAPSPYQAQPVYADSIASDKAYTWLLNQRRPSGLVESFENGGSAANLCVVYDQAIAAQAFILKNDIVNARTVLTTLKSLQKPDGSWHNIYACSNLGIIEWHRDVGPAVWVALAVATYEQATGDTVTFREMALQALNFAYGFQHADGGVNGGFEATAAGYFPHEWGSTEHNQDVYAASRYFYGDSVRAGQVKWFLEETVWDAAEQRWLGGRDDLRDPLDVNSWGVAALGAPYAAALDYNLAQHRVTLGGIDAFDFNSDRNDIWFEGTGQMVVAFQAVGRDTEAAYFLQELIEGQQANGGVPYSLNGTNNGYWDMSAANAVSSAAWLIFAEETFNPLNQGTASITSQEPSEQLIPAPSAGTKAYTWLLNQQQPNGLIESFENGGSAANLCVVYDQAIAAQAFVLKGDLANARKILTTLKSLQWSDGGWHNIYACSNLGIIEWHRDVGPAVWVALAVATYEQATGDTATFREMALRALNFAYGFQQADGGVNGGFEATSAGYFPHEWGSTEHNQDVYAASRYFYGDSVRAGQVKWFLEETVWDAAEQRWLGGRDDLRDPLDVNSWGVAALGVPYAAALDYNLAQHRVTLGGIDAFDFNSDRNDIWFEGTGQMVVAFQAVGRDTEAAYFLQELIEGQQANGGVPYSLNGTNNGYWDMSAANAVSSAAWLIFAEEAFNPLNQGTASITSQEPSEPTTPVPGAGTSAYTWLLNQQQPNGLVESFENGGSAANLCVVYDQAIAAQAFVLKGDLANARKILTTLKSLQWSDGGWHNIYACSNLGIIEWHRDVGPAVWVALAVATYEQATGDTATFREMALRALNFGLGFQQADGGVNGGFEATAAGYIPHEWGSTEHNQDVLAATRYFPGYQQKFAEIRSFLEETVWDAAEQRWLGGREDLRDPLDVNSWGVAALGAPYAAALDYNLAQHRVTLGGIDAFDFNSDHNDIWFEGTGQMVVAFQAVGRDTEAAYFLQELIEGQQANGGVPYSLNGTNNGYWDMSAANAVSSAAWLIFAEEAYNPLMIIGNFDTEAPSAPTNLQALAYGTTSVSLSWSPSADNVGVTRYAVFIDENSTPTASCSHVTTTSCTVTALQGASTYSFGVKAYDTAGNSSAPSNSITVTTDAEVIDTEAPSAPTNLQALDVTASSVQLAWDASSDNVGVTHYAVFVDGAATPTSSCASVSTTTCTVTGLEAATTYSFIVKAYDARANESERSEHINATTEAVAAFANPWFLLDGNGQLSHNAGTTAASDTIPAADNGNADGQASTTLVYAAHGLTASYDASQTTQFEFYIDAQTTIGNGTQARVSYDFTDDGSWDRVETYHYFATDPVTGWELYSHTRGLHSATGTFADLNNGRVQVELWNALGSSTSLVRTSASNADGQQSWVSLPFETSGGPVDTEPPTAPTNLSSPSQSATTINIVWDAADDNVGITGYTAFINNAATPAQGCNNVATTSCTLTGLQANTNYTIAVKAYDAAGNGSQASASINVSTSDTAPPSSHTFYLLDGATQQGAGELGANSGSAAASDTIPAAGAGNNDGNGAITLVYEVHNLNGTYDSSKTTNFEFYIDAQTTVGNGTQARVSYDFTGDGSWDRVETYHYFATDPVAGWELYSHTRGLRSATGNFADLNNGRVQVELWNALGSSTSLVRTSATTVEGQQSILEIPFN